MNPDPSKHVYHPAGHSNRTNPMTPEVDFNVLASDYRLILEQLRDCQDQLRKRNSREIREACALELLAEYEFLLRRMSSVCARALFGTAARENP